jgi:hypothetical protein
MTVQKNFTQKSLGNNNLKKLQKIASQELQVKNCKSRIASQELQVKNCKSRIEKSRLDSLVRLIFFFAA